jgi:deoxyribodipyrimidine photolyase
MENYQSKQIQPTDLNEEQQILSNEEQQAVLNESQQSLANEGQPTIAPEGQQPEQADEVVVDESTNNDTDLVTDTADDTDNNPAAHPAADNAFNIADLDPRLGGVVNDVREGADAFQSVFKAFSKEFNAEIAKRLGEAEEQAYQRGRNEAIAQELSRPAPFANPQHETITSADDQFLVGYDGSFW